MKSGKSLTIGVTVNLEHYENLRLEVSGEIECEDDATRLVQFLDDMLGRLGQDDPATRDRVESYRRRVLASGLRRDSPGVPAASKQGDIDIAMKSATGTSAGEGQNHILSDTGMSLPPETITSKAAHATESGLASPGEERVEKKKDLPPETSEEYICESCGAAISAAEKKMSQLFTNKTLCKSCMKKT